MSNNSREAIEKLFNKHFAILVIYASKYVHSLTVAEDIVQDTFAKLWEKSEDHKCSKAYLFTCVHNNAINYCKSAKIQISELQDIHTVPPTSEVLERIVEQTERKKLLFDAIGKLPPKTYMVLKKVYLEGNSYSNVAINMGVSINTIRTHMFRAFKILKSHLLTFFLAISANNLFIFFR